MRMPRTENTQHEVAARPTGHAATREVLLGNSFQAQNKGRRPRPSRNNTEPADGGLSLVLNGVPHLLAARTHAGVAYRNTHRGGRAVGTTARAPLSSELRHCTACPRPKPSVVEATWAQPLIREELS